MRMNFGEVIEIEDLCNHPAATVVSLAIRLAGSVNVRPDPKRKGFYEVDGGSRVFYICVLPSRCKVLLLASWRNTLPPVPQLNAGVAVHA